MNNMSKLDDVIDQYYQTRQELNRLSLTNERDEFGQSAMMFAMRNNENEMVRDMIHLHAPIRNQRFPAKEHLFPSGYTLLMYAIRSLELKTVRAMFDSYEADELELHAVSGYGRTAFMVCFERGVDKIKIAELLLEKGADINQLIGQTDERHKCRTVLEFAAAYGDGGDIQFLITHGALIRHTEIAKQLDYLELFAEDNGLESLTVEELNESIGVIEVLLDNGVRPVDLSKWPILPVEFIRRVDRLQTERALVSGVPAFRGFSEAVLRRMNAMLAEP